MESIAKAAASSNTALTMKDKNALMRFRQIHQDCLREYRQYQVSCSLTTIGCTDNKVGGKKIIWIENDRGDIGEGEVIGKQPAADGFVDNGGDGHH